MLHDPRPELTFGNLALTDPDGALNGQGFTIEAMAEGTEWGNPQPVIVAIKSLLQDGSLVQKIGDDNREGATLRVTITAGNSAALALGEAALVAEVGRRNTLTWTPPDGWGPATVFDVVMSSLSFSFDDLDELLLQRVYVVKLTCAPFGRSVESVQVTAIASAPASPVLTPMDNGSSTAGWAGSPGAVTTDGNRVRTAQSGVLSTAAVTLSLTKTFGSAQSMAGTPYLTVDFKTDALGTPTITVVADGIALTQVAAQPSPAGYKRWTYACPAASITKVKVAAAWPSQSGRPAVVTRQLLVDTIIKSDQVPTAGTLKQRSGVIPVAGSVRTVGSLAIEHETSGLGAVAVYTFADDGSSYQPPLRGFRASGGTPSADPTAMSGVTDSLDTLLTFSIPVGFLPAGGYVLMARMKCDVTDYGVNWSVASKLNGTVLQTISGSQPFFGLSVNTFRMQALASLVLPIVAMSEDSGGTVELTLQSANPSGDTITLDEAWLFNLDLGSVTIVSCGAGTPAAGSVANRLWIDQPSIDTPLPRLWIGTVDDRSDSWAPGTVDAWGVHSLDPPSVNVFVATAGADGCEVSLTHHPRWHTHAGQ